jgi:hypothetical protein
LESAKSKSFWGGLGFTSKKQNVSVPQEFSVGGRSKNRTEFPEHKSPKQAHKNHEETGIKNPRRLVFSSNVVNPFTRAPRPPFIGRWRDFYIPRLPPNLENIPNVNMYMNVLYIP